MVEIVFIFGRKNCLGLKAYYTLGFCYTPNLDNFACSLCQFNFQDKMVNLGLLSGTKTCSSVTLCFKIPYYTQWGQQILVCGSEPTLGAWNVKRGILLKPSHRGDELIWSGSLAVPCGFNFEYSYYVVDDEKNVLRWEAGKKRKMTLPSGVENGQLVELHDLWQVLYLASHIVFLLFATMLFIAYAF